MMSGRVVYLTDVPQASEIKLFSNEPDVMTVNKVAELLDVVPMTVRREIQRGALECIHVGTRVRITKKQLLKYIGEVNE